MGIGDWGLGIGPNPQSPIPNPQSPIPNPHITYIIFIIFENKKNKLKIFIYFSPKINSNLKNVDKSFIDKLFPHEFPNI